MSSNWLSGIAGDSGVFKSSASSRSATANASIGAGALFLQKKQYDLAIRALQQATAYQPNSSRAYYLMAHAYLGMDRTDDAIASYQRAIRTNPADTTSRFELATLYTTTGHSDQAQKELEQIVAAEPSAVDARMSLGFAYLSSDRLGEAAVQFDAAIRLAPRSAIAHYGMGMARGRQGDATTSLRELQRAVELDPKYAPARSELAFAYLAADRKDQAAEQSSALSALNTAESVEMAQQIELAMLTPKISYLDASTSTFSLLGLQNTPLSQLDSQLATPGASVTFAVSFVFNQAMDIASVQNVFNWSITRASGGEGGVYNNGANLAPEKDASLMPIPTAVQYDPLTQRATVYFRLTQNATGDAVIDPKHILFQFRGTDAGGKPMDPLGDQFDGWTMHRF